MRIRKWAVAVFTLLALIAAACGGDDEPEDEGTDTGSQEEAAEFDAGTPMAEWQEEGTVTIGVKFDVPPFGFENPDTGDVEGFDVDLGNYIADRLGAEPEFIEAISDNRIPFLEEGTADLILSTMTITTDRDAEIDFSRPYFIAHGRILVPSDSDIQGVEDLGGKKVCTATGSTYEATITEQAPDADLRLVDLYSECFELIQNGAVDAVSTDDVILTGMIIQDDSLKLVGDQLTKEPYGVGMANDNPELQAFLDETIEASFEDGTWDELYEKWVGQYTGEEPDHPQDYTLQDALDLFPCLETC
ncbi:MAG TPA: glutamate ABC transporter substrate-binding protein [Actinomycetota bacterium]|nr:glutamate ABC transporter substrate-binding protein [Actinomycetota bacterium]